MRARQSARASLLDSTPSERANLRTSDDSEPVLAGLPNFSGCAP